MALSIPGAPPMLYLYAPYIPVTQATPLVITDAIIAEFREFYEEFTVAKWSDAKVRKALNIALGEMGGNWGSYLPAYSIFQRGLFSLAAHNLTATQAAADATGTVGSASTPLIQTGKSVRDESSSYASPGYLEGLSGWEYLLSLTPYGIEFLHLRMRTGMGAICV